MAEKLPEFLYHYTNEKGLDGILRSKQIKSSPLSGRDAAFGQGVYMTSLPRSIGKDRILANNYDGAVRSNPDKADCYIKFRTQDLKRVTSKVGDSRLSRDIWLVKEDVDLTEYDYWYCYQGRSDETYIGRQVNDRQQLDTEESYGGLGTAVAVGTTIAAIGIGLAAVFGSNQARNNRN